MSRVIGTSVLALVIGMWGPSASAQLLGQWTFEEGGFASGGFGEASRTVLDSSSNQNDGYRPDVNRRVSYTNDAYSGDWALDFNNADDTRPNQGVIVVPHSPTLEPNRGYIDARIKVEFLHEAIVVTKSTFQFLRTEPGPQPPIFQFQGEDRLIGRTVYHLMMNDDGTMTAVIADDGTASTPGNLGGPWTSVQSLDALVVGEWNHVAMAWTGCLLSVSVNGVWAPPVRYEPIPAAGLSYRATGDDPTYGFVDADLSLASGGNPFIGKMDDVRIATPTLCSGESFEVFGQLLDWTETETEETPRGREFGRFLRSP